MAAMPGQIVGPVSESATGQREGAFVQYKVLNVRKRQGTRRVPCLL